MISLKFRNLGDPGGPEFTEGQVGALAATLKVQDGTETSKYHREGLYRASELGLRSGTCQSLKYVQRALPAGLGAKLR
jgi:hypothetical protein